MSFFNTGGCVFSEICGGFAFLKLFLNFSPSYFVICISFCIR